MVELFKNQSLRFCKTNRSGSGLFEIALDGQVPITAELAEKTLLVITDLRPDTRLALQKDYDQWHLNSRCI